VPSSHQSFRGSPPPCFFFRSLFALYSMGYPRLASRAWPRWRLRWASLGPAASAVAALLDSPPLASRFCAGILKEVEASPRKPPVRGERGRALNPIDESARYNSQAATLHAYGAMGQTPSSPASGGDQWRW